MCANAHIVADIFEIGDGMKGNACVFALFLNVDIRFCTLVRKGLPVPDVVAIFFSTANLRLDSPMGFNSISMMLGPGWRGFRWAFLFCVFCCVNEARV